MTRRLAVPLAVWSAAAPAHATTGSGDLWHDLLFPAINLALLLAVLFYFGRKPIQDFFRDRRAQIRDDLETAARLRAQAEERCTELQRRLLNLDAEIERIRSLARERAESERERILSDAAAAAERIRADARGAVEQELRRAREELRQEASDLAIEMAGKRLREQITDSDRDRLLDEFIDRVERGDAGGAGAGRRSS